MVGARGHQGCAREANIHGGELPCFIPPWKHAGAAGTLHLEKVIWISWGPHYICPLSAKVVYYLQLPYTASLQGDFISTHLYFFL